MKKELKFKELKPLEAVHEAATDLYNAGIMKKKTMKEFDAICLPIVRTLSPRQIKQIRLKANVSQSLFAKYLNTSPSTIKHWEIGEKHPKGTSLKLLNMVADNGLDCLI